MVARASSPCTTDGCSSSAMAAGLCRKHYMQQRSARSRPCSRESCPRKAHSCGLCLSHYLSARAARCPHPGCSYKARAKFGGFCGMHNPSKPPRRPCSVDGCKRKARAFSEWCSPHHERAQRYGSPTADRPLPKGWTLDSDGYRLIRPPAGYLGHVNATGYAYEHRVVMERVLGRSLRREESVHHKNGDRADNRPDNLEIWSRAQPAGQRAEDKVRYALEILSLYGAKREKKSASPSPQTTLFG